MRLRALLLPLTVALLLLGAPMVQASAYPGTDTCATLEVSTTAPAPGEHITVDGAHFDGGATVRLVYDTGATLGTVKTSANGSFSTTVTIPHSSGQHVITGRGGDSGQPSSCGGDPTADITVQGGSGSDAAQAVSTSSGSGTAFTGTDVALLLAVAAALITVGVGVNRKARAGKRVSV